LKLHIIDPTSNCLEKHINEVSNTIKIIWYENQLFINTKEELGSFFKPSKKKFFQTSFYKQQRKQRDILMISGEPEGGNWTYDIDNRKKYPKDKIAPHIQFPDNTKYHK
jgi:deoxyribodipyrimidine photolyase-related protein